ncbi:MAG: hypothetical protein FWF25_00250 [Propionibacteriaceae bacterium]|nr:hypothetical protein [Propionibacteriaceae bacterium]
MASTDITAPLNPWRQRLHSWFTAHPATLWITVPIVIYLVFVCLGVTQSSIGIDLLRQDPSAPMGFQIGVARPIRSDEFLTGTPTALGIAETGQTTDLNPLTSGAGVLSGYPTDPISSIVLFDRSLLRLGTILPVASVFSAYWWLPTLLLTLALPALFRFLTGNRWLGLFAAVLMFANPSNVWWSFLPTNILGYAVAGCFCLVAATQAWRRRAYLRSVLLMVPTSVLLAHTVFQYQPYAIVMVPGVLLPTVVALWAKTKTRVSSLIAVGIAGILTLAWVGVVLIQAHSELSALTDTVYPGSRRSTGFPSSPGSLFGAPALFDLGHASVVGSNQSEITSGYNIFIVLALVLALSGLRFTSRRLAWAWRAGVGVCGVWLAWCMVFTGNWSARLPLFNLVPPARARQSVGEVIAFLLCLTLAAAPKKGKPRIVLMGTLIAAGITAWAASDLSAGIIPSLSFRDIAVATVGVGVVSALLLWRPRLWVGYGLTVLLSAATVITVNPILFGLGDLYTSSTAVYFRDAGLQARQTGQLWATDDTGLIAVMAASGVPTINSRILSGPNHAAWSRLDPNPQDSDLWNRGGGTHIWIQWDDAATDVSLSNPSPDVIIIDSSPCVLAARIPNLEMITSHQPLDASCLTPAGSVEWGGQTNYVYSVNQ